MSTTTITRLHSHVDGDPEGSRRCTHPAHVGDRILDWSRENFYRYPLKEGSDESKPETCSWGSWCADCRRADSKVKRDARKANTPADDTPRDYSGMRTF